MRKYVPTAVNIVLTLAGVRAFKPAVIGVAVANSSALLKPRAAWSTATELTRFLERATVWACHCRQLRGEYSGSLQRDYSPS